MKITLPVIATVAVLTVLQAGYPLVRPASARPLLALAHMKKAVLADAGDLLQVHVNATDGTLSVNGQTGPAGQPYVQNNALGSIQIGAPIVHTSVGPNGQSSTTMEFTIDGSSQRDLSSLSPDLQALVQKAMQGAMNNGQSSSVSATINGKQVDPQQIKSLLNMVGINLSISSDPASH